MRWGGGSQVANLYGWIIWRGQLLPDVCHFNFHCVEVVLLTTSTHFVISDKRFSHILPISTVCPLTRWNTGSTHLRQLSFLLWLHSVPYFGPVSYLTGPMANITLKWRTNGNYQRNWEQSEVENTQKSCGHRLSTPIRDVGDVVATFHLTVCCLYSRQEQCSCSNLQFICNLRVLLSQIYTTLQKQDLCPWLHQFSTVSQTPHEHSGFSLSLRV